MKYELLQKFISESKLYLSHATQEQKIRLVQLLERAQRSLEKKPLDTRVNNDFLEEK